MNVVLPVRSTGTCECCGQPVWVLVMCVCGHGVTAHSVTATRSSCYAADASGPCGCSRLDVVEGG